MTQFTAIGVKSVANERDSPVISNIVLPVSMPGGWEMSKTTSIGRHLIADLIGCVRIDDSTFVERELARAGQAAGANVLRVVSHDFGPGMGVTGVALLSESHISIHTWPEFDLAAVDVFVCGKADPNAAVDSLVTAFNVKQTHLTSMSRGLQTNTQFQER